MARRSGYAVFDKEQKVHVSDGTCIAYTVRGDGSRVPVVLANGWSCCDAYWAFVVPFLEERGHVVVLPDTRGHGESGLPRSPGFRARNITVDDMSVERIARDLVEVCDAAGVGPAVFAGHSMGVQVILEVFRIAPERVLALVPVAGPYENPMRTLYGTAYLDRVFPLARMGLEWSPLYEAVLPAFRRLLRAPWSRRGAIAVRAAGEKLDAENFAYYMEHLATRDPLVMFKAAESMRRHSAADVLPKVDVPMVILAGSKDTFSPPAVQQKMHELAPGSELVWFEDAGHTLPLEEPDAINDALAEFLDRLERGDVAGTGA